MKENLCRPGGVISTHLGWPPASRQAAGKSRTGARNWAAGGDTAPVISGAFTSLLFHRAHENSRLKGHFAANVQK